MEYGNFLVSYSREIEAVEKERLKLISEVDNFIKLLDKPLESCFVVILLDDIFTALYLHCRNEEFLLSKLRISLINMCHLEHLELKLSLLDLREELIDNPKELKILLNEIISILASHLLKNEISDFFSYEN